MIVSDSKDQSNVLMFGKRDLILKTKIKDLTDWVVQDDLNVF